MFKNIVRTAHWVGNSQLISLDTDDLFKRTPDVDEKQASVTGNTMKQSVSQFYYNRKKKVYLKRLMMILM